MGECSPDGVEGMVVGYIRMDIVLYVPFNLSFLM
jgi:hypothetical protein